MYPWLTSSPLDGSGTSPEAGKDKVRRGEKDRGGGNTNDSAEDLVFKLGLEERLSGHQEEK